MEVLVIIVILCGIIWLQVFLSKKHNKRLGLILPIICVLLSIVTVIGFSTFNTKISNNSVTYGESGNVVESKVNTANDNKVNTTSLITGDVILFLISNIPTVILLCIYFGLREQKRVDKSIEKMKIKDL